MSQYPFFYDGNSNLVSKTDPDGYTTEYTYNALDLVTSINYNNAKEVSYRYNATGDLVSMTDWLGTTTFELDLLHQITAATDHKGNRVEYTYDGVGNQTSIAYPDGTTATYDYDLVQNQTNDYLTSPVSLKVTSWTHYNEWGEITHNAVLKCGQRELDLVKRYATHDYDNVLDLYYAKARFYDADNRRFVTVDPILDPSQYDVREYVDDPTQMVQYLYVIDNPLIHFDPNGLCYFDASGRWTHDNWEYIVSDSFNIQPNPRKFTLTQGSQGYAVSALQQLLVKYKYLANTDIDGSFGPRTLKAVKEFQYKNGLDVDGSVGPNTWAAFFASDVVDARTILSTSNEPLIYMPEQRDDFWPVISPLTVLPNGFFDRDMEQRIWYSNPDAMQQYGGYNDFYDFVFNVVDYSKFISTFDYDGYEWRIEGWKGNYLNMGVGAEIGIYYRSNPELADFIGFITEKVYDVADTPAVGDLFKFVCEEHFVVPPDEIWSKVRMQINLYYQDPATKTMYLIFTRPEQAHWWLNGFRPDIGTLPSEDLVVTGSITLLTAEMARSFVANVSPSSVAKLSFSGSKKVNINWIGG